MPLLRIICPVTKKPVGTGYNLDLASFIGTSLSNNTVGNCPECGGSHVWDKKDVIVDDEGRPL